MANSIEEAYYTWLNTQTNITTLAPVYWIEADAGDDTPYIVFWLVDDAGTDQYIKYKKQGVARVQNDIWHRDRALGALIRTRLRDALRDMHETVGGYDMYVEATTEQTLPRVASGEPYHFIVDAVIRWRQ